MSHTLEKGLNLVKPNDNLDLLLVPPTLPELAQQIGSMSGSLRDEFNSQVNSQHADPLRRVQTDWMLAKMTYERHLQHYGDSPLHRVVLLPPLNTTDTFSSSLSQQELEVQTRLEDFLAEQNGAASQRRNQTDAAYTLQSEGVHPVVEHCISATGLGVCTAGAMAKPEADVLIARLRDGKRPILLPNQSDKEVWYVPTYLRCILSFVLCAYRATITISVAGCPCGSPWRWWTTPPRCCGGRCRRSR
jgi:hypothetical protein